ncbi:MAG: hypothetical protein KJ638_13420 [Chloroflexi bacterium]|nr:hypothetical protein [Chloroflexota bacterium]
MHKKIYEFSFEIHCGDYEFHHREWKIIDSFEKANDHGIELQNEFNAGMSPYKVANKCGYSYELEDVREVTYLDGHRITVHEAKNA